LGVGRLILGMDGSDAGVYGLGDGEGACAPTGTTMAITLNKKN
jgi:hypothetical protein